MHVYAHVNARASPKSCWNRNAEEPGSVSDVPRIPKDVVDAPHVVPQGDRENATPSSGWGEDFFICSHHIATWHGM